MTRRSSPSPGTVVWLAGTEVDRFPSFERFFLAMIDYNRLELQKLQEASGGPMKSEAEMFVMKIAEIFSLQDGRTVFVGLVEAPSTYVGPRRCVLLLDGKVVQVLQIEGEMLPEKRSHDERRVVSTLDELAIPASIIRGSDAELRGV
jgi:hypothetical protein